MPDTGLKSPSAEGDDYIAWANPTNAYVSDDAYADDPSLGDQHDWYNFAFGVPPGATITGILVTAEIHSYSEGYTAIIELELSWDGGTSYTTSGKDVTTTSATDETQTAGGAADLWGRAWSDTEFSDANFRVRGTGAGSRRVYLDHLQITVHYTVAAVAGYALVF